MMKWVLPALEFLNQTGGAFTTSLYPFYKWRNLGQPAWCSRPGYGPCGDQPLAFAVGSPDAAKKLDTNTGLLYDSSLSFMIDAVLFALAKHGFANLQFIVGETGWPTAGMEQTMLHGDSRNSNAAACWAMNTVSALLNKGTPAANRLGFHMPIVYGFQWIDEVGKFEMLGRPEDPGPIEDHFGVLDSWLKPKFPLDLETGQATCTSLPDFASLGFAGQRLQTSSGTFLAAYGLACTLLTVSALFMWSWQKVRGAGTPPQCAEPLLAA